MKKLAVLISNAGTGSNLQAIIDAIEDKKLLAEITVVVSDTKDALGLQRAYKHNLPTYISKNSSDLMDTLSHTYIVDFIILAGWKQVVSQEMIAAFQNRILNIHPGLIPDNKTSVVKNPDNTDSLWNKGKFTDKAIQSFLDAKATYAGSSVHFLTGDFDFGPVLTRCFEKIESGDTIESLYSRLKKKENEICVEALRSLCNVS